MTEMEFGTAVYRQLTVEETNGRNAFQECEKCNSIFCPSHSQGAFCELPIAGGDDVIEAALLARKQYVAKMKSWQGTMTYSEAETWCNRIREYEIRRDNDDKSLPYLDKYARISLAMSGGGYIFAEDYSIHQLELFDKDIV